MNLQCKHENHDSILSFNHAEALYIIQCLDTVIVGYILCFPLIKAIHLYLPRYRCVAVYVVRGHAALPIRSLLSILLKYKPHRDRAAYYYCDT